MNVMILNFNQDITDNNVYMLNLNTQNVDEFGFDIDNSQEYQLFKEHLYSQYQRQNGYDTKLDELLEINEQINLFGIPIPISNMNNINKYISLYNTFEYVLDRIYDYNIDILYFDFDINIQFNPIERYQINKWLETNSVDIDYINYPFLDYTDDDVYKLFSLSKSFINEIESVYKPFFLFRIQKYEDQIVYKEYVIDNDVCYVTNNVISSYTISNTQVQNQIYQNNILVGTGEQIVQYEQDISTGQFTFHHVQDYTFYDYINSLYLEQYKEYTERYTNVFVNYMYGNQDRSLQIFIKEYIKLIKGEQYFPSLEEELVYPSRNKQLNDIRVGFSYMYGEEEINVIKVFDYQLIDKYYVNFIMHNILKEQQNISKKYIIGSVDKNVHFQGKSMLEDYLNTLKQNQLIYDYRVDLQYDNDKAELNVYIKDKNINKEVFKLI